MKKAWFFVLISALGLFIISCITGRGVRDDWTVTGGKVVKYYNPTSEAFANPMKGFRPGRFLADNAFPQREYATVYRHYIKYTDLEYSPNDTAQKIIDWSNREWAGIEQRNVKVIPRVVIAYPNGPDGGDIGYWPAGIDYSDPVGVWRSEALKQRLAAFIEKLGEAWNNDPRVAAIEAGLWGQWGEHHIWPAEFADGTDRIPLDFQRAMGDAFTRAFPDKKVMIRYPDRFVDFDFGCYWDSFAKPDDMSGFDWIRRDTWRTQMISGEVAYDYGDLPLIGSGPDATLSSDANTDNIIDWVNMTHASSLGWISEYNPRDARIATNAARLQKAFGYRYVVQRAMYDRTVQQGKVLSLTFEVTNTGSAPFYYQWPVEVGLLDKQRNPVWTGIVHVDIRNWRPTHVYTVRDEFVIPLNVPTGTYTLALAILDPNGNVPSLRFANANYYKGGRMPLGKIGIGREPESDELDAFDRLKDDSLFYTLEPASTPVGDRQVYPLENDPPPRLPGESVDSIFKAGNLAYQKPVTVSSIESAYANYPEKAVDGDPKTRWSSEWQVDPSWIAIDLEARTTIGRVNLSWEWSYAREYEIQVSNNGESWTTVYHTNAGRGEEEEISFNPVEARFVRVFCIQRALQWGYSLYEVEVYAP